MMHTARAFWWIYGFVSFDNKGQLPKTTARLYVDLNNLPRHANNIAFGTINHICH